MTARIMGVLIRRGQRGQRGAKDLACSPRHRPSWRRYSTSPMSEKVMRCRRARSLSFSRAEVGVLVSAKASRRQYRRFHVVTRQFESNAGLMPTRPTPMKAIPVSPAVADCHDVEAIEGFLVGIVVQVAEVLAVETIAFVFVHLDSFACRRSQEYRAIETE